MFSLTHIIRTALFPHGRFNRLRHRRPSPLDAFAIHTEVFNHFLLRWDLQLPSYLEFLAARKRRLQRGAPAPRVSKRKCAGQDVG